MANKIHFQATTQGSAACAVGFPTRSGAVVKNARATYATIPVSHIVTPDAFRATPAADRCAHCAAQFTERMNVRRAKSGKPAYKDAFTKEIA